MNGTSEWLLYGDGFVHVVKKAIVERSNGRAAIITREASVCLFDLDLILVDHTKNMQGDIRDAKYDLRGANTFITVLESFRKGTITAGNRESWLIWITQDLLVKATVAQQGTMNLCLRKMSDMKTPAGEDPIYLAPMQAANLEKCIYHVLSFIAGV